MERKSVTSSNVCSVGYDPEAQTLEVEFTNGAVYRYQGVAVEVNQALEETIKEGASVGSFLHRSVKKNFQAERVGKTDNDERSS